MSIIDLIFFYAAEKNAGKKAKLKARGKRRENRAVLLTPYKLLGGGEKERFRGKRRAKNEKISVKEEKLSLKRCTKRKNYVIMIW